MSDNSFKATVAGKKYEVLQRLDSIEGSLHFRVRRRRTDRNSRTKKIDFNKTFHLKMSFVNKLNLIELRIMRSLKHDNVIRLYETLAQRVNNELRFMFMVMEDCGTNLRTLLDHYPRGRFNRFLIRSIMYHLLLGCVYLHANNIAHYNLSPETILVAFDHTQLLQPLRQVTALKISDFRHARYVHKPYVRLSQPFCGNMAYYSPEAMFILAKRRFVTAADMWSVGCIFGEFFTRSLLFPPSTQIIQMQLIENWSQPYVELDACISYESRIVHRLFSGIESKINNCAALHLLDRFFEPNPDSRIQAMHAIHHPYMID